MKKINNECSSLSKFIAQAGVCSRRKATLLIQDGAVTVNGNKIMEPGYKITTNDIVRVQNEIVRHSQDKIYILLNKPKGFITTVEDEKGRKTVLDIFTNIIRERIYPVGRLDRNTTGLLVLTNDGILTQQLSHPSSQIQKIYLVTLDRSLQSHDIQKIKNGIMLEDGFIQVDTIIPTSKSSVEIELHSGRNRIIRRIFEALGYDVIKLDRTHYAHLNKKGLPVGCWRYLHPHEIDALLKI